MKIEIPFSGHKNILSLHKKTIEITKDSKLSVSGDCIVGTNSAIACIDLPEKFKKKIRDPNTVILFTIVADEYSFSIHGKGSEKLTLKHTNDMVLRRTHYIFIYTLHLTPFGHAF